MVKNDSKNEKRRNSYGLRTPQNIEVRESIFKLLGLDTSWDYQ